MKMISKFMMFLATITLGGGITSCNDDPTTTGANGDSVVIKLNEVSYSAVTFTLSAKNAPTLFAYEVALKTDAERTAQQVFDSGIKIAPSDKDIVVRDLVQRTEYVLYAVSMGTNGLSSLTKVDFKTTSDSGAPATASALGIRFNKISQKEMNYTLQRGADVVSGFVCVWPTIILKNYLDEVRIESGGAISDNDAIKSVLMDLGYGMSVDGTEAGVSWTQWPLIPEAEYTVMMVGMLDATTAGDVSTVDFKTLPYEQLLGDPTVTLTTDYINHTSVKYRYTLNADAYGFMRYVGIPSMIDDFIAVYGEDQLREWVRHTDNLFEQIYQTKHTMEKDENGNPAKSENFFLGWEAAGAPVVALAVACDDNLSVSKRVARLDVVLTAKPEGDPAVYTVSGIEPTATTAKIHFDFSPNCHHAYYNVLPANSYKATIAAEGGELAYARKLDLEGNGIGRDGAQRPTDPIYNNDWYWTNLSPEGSYVIVSTAVSYDGLLNETLLISDPFTTKPLVYGGSTVTNISAEFDEIGKYSARGVIKVPDNNIALFYNAIFEKSDPINDLSDAEIRQTVLDYGDIWLWLQEKSPDYDPKQKAEVWTWSQFEANTEYVFYYCAEDNDGHITNLGRTTFTTLPATTGPNPDATLSAHNITATSCLFDIIVNDDVHKFRYLAIQDEVLDYNPATDTQKQLEDAIYDMVIGDLGMDARESKRNMELVSTTPNSTWYLGVIAYGTSDGSSKEEIETFKYLKITLGNGKAVPTARFVKTMSMFHKITGSGDSKSFAGWSAANIKSFDRSQAKARAAEAADAQKAIEQMDGYMPFKASEILKRYYKR